MHNVQRSGYKDYKLEHLPNSHFIDIDHISDKNNDLPHMIPQKKYFERKVSNLGVSNRKTIILYSSSDILGSSRIWWMFKYFGHEKVFILNGGLSKWKKEKKPLTSKKSKKVRGSFKAYIKNEWIASYDNISHFLYKKDNIIIDARDSKRFHGLVSEPRKGLKKGHIPTSSNLFWKKLIKKNGLLQNKKIIINLFKSLIKSDKNIITTCGSGVSACVLSLSLYYASGIKSSVYDGSWAEWGRKKGAKIEK